MSSLENRPRSSSYSNSRKGLFATPSQHYPSPTSSLPSMSVTSPTFPSFHPQQQQQPDYHQRNHHPSSPPQQQQSQEHHHHHHKNHHHHQGNRRYSKHRLSNASSTTLSSFNSYYSTVSTTSRPLRTFEIMFTNIIDALIFTSAIAITAYNYWMGYIVETPRLYGQQQQSSKSQDASLLKRLDIPSPLSSNKYHRPSLDSSSSPSSPLPCATRDPWLLLKRTEMEAPEPQTQQQNVSAKKEMIHIVNKNDDDDDDDDHVNEQHDDEQEEEEEEEEEEDCVNRMEETLQALIRQGQEALTSPIDWQ
ncbi:uncharacterized protein BX664DRAFT_329500 [Halteromyces radiatus]|uniref:uncharacterized protein n=1 Tax=Halteromyces radiatus TaxID=101107 RepID=UPI00221F15FA|nr:uncharacterized protein BX664DRAFT_329500 [Halteromyces radiatus]KAI8093355.1 hypothetical protein BX664DRAFT_329500 [Halteromyces radiatus]